MTRPIQTTITQYSGGYAALVSAIIVSMLLIVFTFGVSSISFAHRFNVLDGENKRISMALTQGCVEVALLNIAKNSTYGGGENITIGARSCKICPISTSGAQKIILTRAKANNAYTNTSVTITQNPAGITINSWQELPTNPDPSCGLP